MIAHKHRHRLRKFFGAPNTITLIYTDMPFPTNIASSLKIVLQSAVQIVR
jgi:hypothetical protein